MQLGHIFFDNTLFVEGILETIISLGQLNQQGCRTELSGGKMKVFGPNGEFIIHVFCFSPHWEVLTIYIYIYIRHTVFLRTKYTTGGSASVFAVSDAKHNTVQNYGTAKWAM